MAPRPDTGQSAEFVEAVFTCKGNYYDPNFPEELATFNRKLHHLLDAEEDRLVIKKVEPWNSVKVTVNIPRDAAERLKTLASQNNGAALSSMGIMSLQMEGDRIISLILANAPNRPVQPRNGPISSTTEVRPPSPQVVPLEGSDKIQSNNTNTSLNNLLNLSHATQSTSKESINAPPNVLAPTGGSRVVKQKSERRQRKPVGNRATCTKRNTKTKNSPTSVVPELPANEQMEENLRDKHLVTNKLDHNLHAGLYDLAPSTSGLVSMSQPTIHPALKDTEHCQSRATTVSVTGVTDKAAVHSLVANLFERSLASVGVTDNSKSPWQNDVRHNKDIPQSSHLTRDYTHQQPSSTERTSEGKSHTAEPPDKTNDDHSLTSSIEQAVVIPTHDLNNPSLNYKDEAHDDVSGCSTLETDVKSLETSDVPSKPDGHNVIAQSNTLENNDTEKNELDIATDNVEDNSNITGETATAITTTTTTTTTIITMDLSTVTTNPITTGTMSSEHETTPLQSTSVICSNQVEDITHLTSETMNASPDSKDVTIASETVSTDNDTSTTVKDVKDNDSESEQMEDSSTAVLVEEVDEISATVPKVDDTVANDNVSSKVVEAELDKPVMTPDTVDSPAKVMESDNQPNNTQDCDDGNIGLSATNNGEEDGTLTNANHEVTEAEYNEVVDSKNVSLEVSIPVNNATEASDDVLVSGPSDRDVMEVQQQIDDINGDTIADSLEVSDSKMSVTDDMEVSQDSYNIVDHNTCHQTLAERMDSTDSQDSILAKQIMVPSINRSPSVSPTPSDTQDEPIAAELGELDNEKNGTGASFDKISNTDFSEALPVIEPGIIAIQGPADHTLTSNDLEGAKPNEDSQDAVKTSHEASCSSILGLSSPDILTQSTDNTMKEINLLKSFSPTLYNPAQVPNELPDEILADDDNSQSDVGLEDKLNGGIPSADSIQSDISADTFKVDSTEKPVEQMQGAPVSVICGPVNKSETTSVSPQPDNGERSATVSDLDPPSSEVQTGEEDIKPLTSVEDKPALDVKSEEQTSAASDAPPQVKRSNSSQHLHIINEHEPAENGSSTSTDSGVVAGSPKSDICATPPSVDDSHIIVPKSECLVTHEDDNLPASTASVPAHIEKPIRTDPSDQVITKSVIDHPKASIIVQTSSHVTVSHPNSSSRPCVSILKTARPVHTTVVNETSVVTTPALTTLSLTARSCASDVTRVNASHKSTPNVTRADPLSIRMGGNQTNLSEVLMAAASAASANQQQAASVLKIQEPYKQPLRQETKAPTSTMPTTLLLASRNDQLVILDNMQNIQEVHPQPFLAVTKNAVVDQSSKSTYYISKDGIVTMNRNHTMRQHVKPVSFTHKDMNTTRVVTNSRENKNVSHVIVSTGLTTASLMSASNGPKYTSVSSLSSTQQTHEHSTSLSLASSKNTNTISTGYVIQKRSHFPTNLPPVRIINSDTVKGKTHTEYSAPFTQESSHTNCDTTNNQKESKNIGLNSSIAITSVDTRDKEQVTSNTDMKVSDSDEPPAKISHLATRKTEVVDNGVHDSQLVNGLGDSHDAECQTPQLLEGSEESLSVKTQLDTSTNEEVKPDENVNTTVNVSTLSQRKSVRATGVRNKTIKSPDNDITMLNATPKATARKRGARQLSEDSNVSDTKEDQIPAVTSAKRATKANNKTIQSASVEPLKPQSTSAQANGPSTGRSKRATRSSGITDLQALPTIYRERKKTKR